MKTTIYFPVTLPDLSEVTYSADITITSFGSPGSWYDPGDPPEWDIDAIFDEEENEIPFTLPPILWEKLYAWFTPKAPERRFNSEWNRLADLIDHYMNNSFDWQDAETSEAEYQWELRYDLAHER